MEILDILDNKLMIALYGILTIFAVAKMNDMYWQTPKIEIAAWWAVAVGAFSVVMFEVHGLNTDWGHVFYGLGTMLLIIVNTQPQWRPLIADRRHRETKMEAPCDRRTAHRQEDCPRDLA